MQREQTVSAANSSLQNTAAVYHWDLVKKKIFAGKWWKGYFERLTHSRGETAEQSFRRLLPFV